MSQVCVVTGANGFVGRALTAALAAQGHQVRALVRQPASEPQVDARVTEQVIGDLTQASDTQFTQLLAGADTVFHLAARTHQLNAPRHAYERLNIGVTQQLSAAAVAAGVRHFVFISSVKAIGEETRGKPFSPDTPEHPEDEYGRTKLVAEQMLQAFAASTQLPVSIVRPPLIYGLGAPGNLARLIRLVQRGVPLPFAAIVNRRSMLSRDNLVALLVQLANRPLGRTILPADVHFATPELIRSIATTLSKPPRLFALPSSLLENTARLTGQTQQIRRLTRSLEIADTWLDQTFGWTPPHSPETALAAMVQAAAK